MGSEMCIRDRRYGRPSALTTRPDVAVPLTVEDFLAGRDPVLARALAAD